MDLSPVVVEQVVPVGPDAAFTGFTRDLGGWHPTTVTAAPPSCEWGLLLGRCAQHWRSRVTEPVVRPMVEADLVAVERLTCGGPTTSSRPAPPGARRPSRSPGRARGRSSGWRGPATSATDPGGCWVAEDDSGMLGAAVSYRRAS